MEVHKENISNLRDDRRKEKKEREPDLDLLPVTWVSSYLPIRQIKNGVIYTTDHRYVKLIEILPINFLLRSSSEQRNIIMSFMSYLKIAPVKIQFKVVSKKADISEYIEKIKEEAEREPDYRVKLLQEDYAKLIERLGRKEAITRRFFMVFEYQSYNNNKNPKEREVLLYMRSVVQTAKKYLSQCGNVVLEYENDTRFLVDVLYQILNRKTSVYETLEERTKKVARYYQRENGRESISHIPVTELIAPETMDMRHRSHLVIDGMYYSYLLIPSHKYRTRVPAGWLSLLINAGEGIDVDVFFFRQDKSKSMERIGRRIRLNRSKIKDTYDTNTDFDDLSESIHAGYYLKRGLSGSEDFYYMSTLITITGYSAKEVEWRVREMTKLYDPLDDWENHYREEHEEREKPLFSDSVIDKGISIIHQRLLSDKPVKNYGMNGCCVPGERRIYVTVSGEFLLCEKVGNIPSIGNVNEGFYKDRIKELYVDSFIQEAKKYCGECWAVNLCSMCYVNCFDQNGTHFAYRHNSCRSERIYLENNLVRYHTILEENPERLLEYNQKVFK